jgi:hypothetical protein
MFSDDYEALTRLQRERPELVDRQRLAEARAAEWEARYVDLARAAEAAQAELYQARIREAIAAGAYQRQQTSQREAETLYMAALERIATLEGERDRARHWAALWKAAAQLGRLRERVNGKIAKRWRGVA